MARSILFQTAGDNPFIAPTTQEITPKSETVVYEKNRNSLLLGVTD